MQIVGEIPIDEKRFYIDAKLTIECPRCHENMYRDFNNDYLAYPELNQKYNIHLYCDNCDNEYILPIMMVKCQATLEYNPEELKYYGNGEVV